LNARYVLAPQAARDRFEIWRYIRKQSSAEMADHVESAIKGKFIFLSGNTGAGHIRNNLTAEAVKFFPAYSYLIVYRSETNPLQVVSILHPSRDVERILKNRLQICPRPFGSGVL
jgi:plasmid stabilization system protein ParE